MYLPLQKNTLDINLPYISNFERRMSKNRSYLLVVKETVAAGFKYFVGFYCVWPIHHCSFGVNNLLAWGNPQETNQTFWQLHDLRKLFANLKLTEW